MHAYKFLQKETLAEYIFHDLQSFQNSFRIRSKLFVKNDKSEIILRGTLNYLREGYILVLESTVNIFFYGKNVYRKIRKLEFQKIPGK